MPIPTIPERDEELEKFLHECFVAEGDRVVDGEVSASFAIQQGRRISAFSARRAREKAIEECEKALEKDKQQIVVHEQWEGQQVFHATEVALTFQKLKSQPQ